MTLQSILFVVAIVFFVLAFICIAIAVAVFFARNIPDVQADLSGKKRAAAVAEIAAQRPGRDRRKGVARVEPTSGSLDSGRLSGSSPLDNPLNQVPHVNSVVTPAPAPQAQPVVVEQPKATYQPQPSYQVASIADRPDDYAETSILPDDDQETSILTEEAAAPVAYAAVEMVASDTAATATETAAASVEQSPAPDDSVTTILPDDDSATSILPDDAAASVEQPSMGDVPVGALSERPAEQSEATICFDDASASDDSATTILPGDDSATTILPDDATTPVAQTSAPDDSATTILPGDDSATTILPVGAAIATPEGFTIVRKIVLRDSTDFITTT